VKRGGPLRRTGRLRAQGRRARRDRQALALFQEVVIARAGGRLGRCERCGRDCSIRWWIRGDSGGGVYWLQAHHRHPRSHAPASYKHDPVRNGAALCHRVGSREGCHELVHDHAVEDWARWVGAGAVLPNPI
jgi:hypothetical protein